MRSLLRLSFPLRLGLARREIPRIHGISLHPDPSVVRTVVVVRLEVSISHLDFDLPPDQVKNRIGRVAFQAAVDGLARQPVKQVHDARLRLVEREPLELEIVHGRSSSVDKIDDAEFFSHERSPSPQARAHASS
jgi:hypothetical protein